MSARRTTAVAAASTLALTTLAFAGMSPTTAGAATDDTPGYALRHITVDTLVGPNNDIPCKVDADIYRPDDASRTRKKPAILTTHGFGGSKDDSNQTAVGKGFVKQGYVVLSYTGLGFPDSECDIYLDDPDFDGKAGRQIVSVLAGQKPFNDANGNQRRVDYVAKEGPGDPRVGMIGGSYGGQIQYAVAMQDKRVDALIPIITWNDLSYSLAPNNTDFARGVTYRTPGVAKKQWIDLFFGVGITDGAQQAESDPTSVDNTCPNFRSEACPAAAQLNTAGYPDKETLELARDASVASYVERVKAPTLVVQGQKDTLFNLQESVATFRSLRAQGTPTRLVWQSWGHSGGGEPAPGELDFDAKSLRDSYLGNRFLNWMNHYVKGQRSAPVGPRFSYFRDWVGYDTSSANAGRAIDRAYVERSTFSDAPTATLYFTGTDGGADGDGGGLTRSRSAVKSVEAGDPTATYANTPNTATSFSEVSGVQGTPPFTQEPFDGPGTFAAFTSKPLARAAVIVGSPRLTLQLDSPTAAVSQSQGPAGKLILFAKIYDVAPDGSKALQHRLISPVRVADVTRPVHVQLPGVVQRFKTGHRLQVVVAASDFAYANNTVAHTVTVRTSPEAPSVVRLPLTSELRF